MQGPGFGVQGSGVRVQESGFRVLTVHIAAIDPQGRSSRRAGHRYVRRARAEQGRGRRSDYGTAARGLPAEPDSLQPCLCQDHVTGWPRMHTVIGQAKGMGPHPRHVERCLRVHQRFGSTDAAYCTLLLWPKASSGCIRSFDARFDSSHVCSANIVAGVEFFCGDPRLHLHGGIQHHPPVKPRGSSSRTFSRRSPKSDMVLGCSCCGMTRMIRSGTIGRSGHRMKWAMDRMLIRGREVF